MFLIMTMIIEMVVMMIMEMEQAMIMLIYGMEIAWS